MLRSTEDNRESFYHLREYIYHHEQNTAGDMSIRKCTSGEALEGNDEHDEHVIGCWKKGNLCHQVAETWLNGVLLLGGLHL